MSFRLVDPGVSHDVLDGVIAILIGESNSSPFVEVVFGT
jgi:hypothetical protein